MRQRGQALNMGNCQATLLCDNNWYLFQYLRRGEPIPWGAEIKGVCVDPGTFQYQKKEKDAEKTVKDPEEKIENETINRDFSLNRRSNPNGQV